MPGVGHLFSQGIRNWHLKREGKEIEETIFNKKREHVGGREVMIKE